MPTKAAKLRPPKPKSEAETFEDTARKLFKVRKDEIAEKPRGIRKQQMRGRRS